MTISQLFSRFSNKMYMMGVSFMLLLLLLLLFVVLVFSSHHGETKT